MLEKKIVERRGNKTQIEFHFKTTVPTIKVLKFVKRSRKQTVQESHIINYLSREVVQTNDTYIH